MATIVQRSTPIARMKLRDIFRPTLPGLRFDPARQPGRPADRRATTITDSPALGCPQSPKVVRSGTRYWRHQRRLLGAHCVATCVGGSLLFGTWWAVRDPTPDFLG